MKLVLNETEMAELFRQSPETRSDGGWQGLLVSMQDSCDRTTGEIVLSADHLRRIPRYAFDYGNGGWEARLTAAFGRHLSPSLGRQSSA